MAERDKAPPNINEVMALYCNLMEEIKARHDAVSAAAAGRLPVHPLMAHEFCFLQLRMICELVALACVVAHGDLEISQSPKMKKEDRAGVILKMLEEAHPDFYPRPGKQRIDPKTGAISVDPIEKGFLTKEQLPKLYGICGNFLHRGKVKKIGVPLRQAISFKHIASWCDQIGALLNHHQISIYGSTSQIWIIMNAKQDGKVHWSFMEVYDPELHADLVKVSHPPEGAPFGRS